MDKKLAQLDNRIAEFLAGQITIADLRPAGVHHAWPMLVIAEGLVAAERLWEYVEKQHPEAFEDERVRSLSIIDTDELEQLMALVEESHALHELLARKVTSAWSVLPRRRWIHEELPEEAKPRRPSVVDRNWDAAWRLVLDVVFPDRDRSGAPSRL